MSGVDLDAAANDMRVHGVPASRVQKVSDVVRHPRVLHRYLVIDVGGKPVPGIPVESGRTPGAVRTPPRELGADTRTLRRTGYSDGDIDKLTALGAVVGNHAGTAQD